MLTLKSIMAAHRQGMVYGQGQHFFGRGFAHPLHGQVPRDDIPVGTRVAQPKPKRTRRKKK